MKVSSTTHQHINPSLKFCVGVCQLYNKSSLEIQYLEPTRWLPAESPPQRDPFQKGCCNSSIQSSLSKSTKQTENTMAKCCPTGKYQPSDMTDQLTLVIVFVSSTNNLSYGTNFLPQIPRDNSHTVV